MTLLVLLAVMASKPNCRELVQQDYDKAAEVVRQQERVRHPQEGDDPDMALYDLGIVERDWWETHKQVMKYCPNYPRPQRGHHEDAGVPLP